MEKRLPTLKDDSFYLESGITLHNEAPSTFWIPTDEDKRKVNRGSIVKLCFQIRTQNFEEEQQLHAERMWVVVTDRNEDWFLGQLDNQPTCTDDMKPGLPLYFHSEHIININDSTLDLNSEKFRKYQQELDKL